MQNFPQRLFTSFWITFYIGHTDFYHIWLVWCVANPEAISSRWSWLVSVSIAYYKINNKLLCWELWNWYGTYRICFPLMLCLLIGPRLHSWSPTWPEEPKLGVSAKWVRSSPLCSSFTNFDDALRKTFDPLTTRREKAQDLSRLEQDGDSVCDYAIRFHTLPVESR